MFGRFLSRCGCTARRSRRGCCLPLRLHRHAFNGLIGRAVSVMGVHWRVPRILMHVCVYTHTERKCAFFFFPKLSRSLLYCCSCSSFRKSAVDIVTCIGAVGREDIEASSGAHSLSPHSSIHAVVFYASSQFLRLLRFG